MTDAQKTILDALPPGRGSSAGASPADIARWAVPLITPELGENVATIATQLEQLRPLTQKLADSTAENTQAVTQNTVTQTQSGVASAAGNIAKTAARTLGGALSLAPLVSALVGLFKKDKPEPPALQTYTLPPSIQFQGAVLAGGSEGIVAMDYGQDGLPRAVATRTQNSAPSVTVQVQAIDSRSFMDHSDEIARAVREALLNAHSLSDVMSEL